MLMTTSSTHRVDTAPVFPGARGIPAFDAEAERDCAERRLVAALQRGDDDAYETLVRQYGGTMLAVARRLLRHEDNARDAVQEAFLQAFRAIQHFRAEARLSTWLHRIVVNAALMRHRSASRRPEVPIDDLLPRFEDDGHHAEPVQALPDDVESSVDSARTRARVRACVERLPDQYRAVIVLRDLEELSTAEAAQALGITENAVKIRLHRARQALHTLLVGALAERAE